MDFRPDHNQELLEFQAEVSEWLAIQMADSGELRWSATWSIRADTGEYDYRRELARKLGSKGWLFPSFPKEYGGAGLSPGHDVVIQSELMRLGLPSHLFYTVAWIAAPTILIHGSESQRQEFLPPMSSGEVSVWQLITEPQSGSDMANCQTRAVRDGDSFRVWGQKVMVGSSHDPDYLWTLVNTDPDGKRHENLSWLYIPADTPGISLTPMRMMMGVKNAVYFDDVVVPDKYLVGRENDGWRVSKTHMELEHGGAGIVKGSPGLERLVRHCIDTQREGTRLIDQDGVLQTLADAVIDSHVGQLFGMRNAWHRGRRDPHPYGGVQLRYVNRMSNLKFARTIQDVLGYEALFEDLSVNEDEEFQYLVREGPGHLHGGGTQDTDRLIFARRLGLGRRSVERAEKTVWGEGQ